LRFVLAVKKIFLQKCLICQGIITGLILMTVRFFSVFPEFDYDHTMSEKQLTG